MSEADIASMSDPTQFPPNTPEPLQQEQSSDCVQSSITTPNFLTSDLPTYPTTHLLTFFFFSKLTN